MFGNFSSEQTNKMIEKVEFQYQEDSRYRSANSNQEIVIDTALGRAYINNDSYFSNVPESVWNISFAGKPSPKRFLDEQVGKELTDQSIIYFQQLVSDLIDAEFKSKS